MVKEEQIRYSVGDVATQTQRVMIDNIENKQYDLYEYLAKIGNDIETIKKSLQ